MKRKSFAFILSILLIVFFVCGCGKKSTTSNLDTEANIIQEKQRSFSDKYDVSTPRKALASYISIIKNQDNESYMDIMALERIREHGEFIQLPKVIDREF